MQPFQQLIGSHTKYQLIGDEILSIVLQPREKFFGKHFKLSYFSPNIISQSTSSRTPFSFDSEAETEFVNETNMIGYIGLSHESGTKILVLDASIYMDYHVRESAIIGYGEHTQLESSTYIAGRYKKLSMNKAHLHQQQCVFVGLQGAVIDKELSLNEQIMLKQCVIIAIQDQTKSTVTGESIIVTGPGRVLFALQPAPRAKIDLNEVVAKTFLLCCSIALYFLLRFP